MKRWMRIALPVAVGVVILALVPRLYDLLIGGGSSPPPESERSPRSEAQAPPLGGLDDPPPAPHASAIFPTGSFDEAPSRFTWTRDPGATSYRIEVRDESNALVFSAETADSTIAYPGAELAARHGSILSWRVVPKGAAGDLAPSAPLRFQVGP